ncbi:hypothetical protein AVEN_194350-1 [Araneus ventricosus]|uniref:DNA helicase Pif1-like 2B domain-containing protein n=1 Tax=Araneus ventricosus TaxID=182803 RepID=A0A4Y2L502_ARAVE|nr:hypothetical protein AVEN_194350-1 [Araneus ventricosus]
MDKEQAVYYTTEFLNSLNPPGIPSRMLNLKVAPSIMLLGNLDPPKLYNGTIFCVRKFMANVIQATILTGNSKGESVFIPCIPLIPSDVPFEFKLIQFNVPLALAIKINKTQDKSFKATGINLKTSC